MASLGKLAAVVAHEINNPLAGISTYAKLLHRRMTEGPVSDGAGEDTDRDGGDGDTPSRDGAGDAAKGDGGRQDTARILSLIDTEARRCGDIVRNLLLFSRSSSADFAPCEIPPLIQRCIMLVRHQAELGEIRLDVHTAADLPEVDCDAAQIQQMILALLMNAIEASEAGGTVSVSAAIDGDEGCLILTVRDTGNGIPPEHLSRIFEPFFTTKEEGAGVGLGLAVVYGIVHRHHGHCAVDSSPGEGTTFNIRLPLRQTQPAEKEPVL
jgi:two-component system NtrC family sensor kinase